MKIKGGKSGLFAKKTYSASEMVVRLQRLIVDHGDLPMLVHEDGVDVLVEAGVMFMPKDKTEGWPDRIEITTPHCDYRGDRPLGNVDEK